MEEKDLKKIMEEIEEELELTKRRIFWKLTEIRESKSLEYREPQTKRSDRSFFTLD